MARSWYEIRNIAGGDEADVYLYDEIGMWGVTANDFARDIRAIKASTINLRLNSPGGEVFDGIAIFNTLKNHPAAVNVFVDGLAASSASFIAQAGDRIVMAKNATMMIHEPYGMAMGDAATMTKMAEELNLVGEQIAGIYADRATETSAEDWRAAMVAETWYKAQDAVDAGLADEVAGAPATKNAAVKVFNLSKFKNVPKWVAQAKAAASSKLKDAGRTMSQGNLDKLHSGMSDITAAHDGACDMAGDCPVNGTSNRVISPLNDDLTVCLAPECDMPAVLELPLCKDHVEFIMGAGPAPTGQLEVGAVLAEADNALLFARGGRP